MRIPDTNKSTKLVDYRGQQVTMGIRPEHIVEQSRVPGGAVPDDAFIPVTVDVVELLGNEIFVYLTTRNSTLTARMDPDLKLERGQEINIALEPSKLHFFDIQTEQSIL
jgi:multiple sugar transport system ATP-binding protein